MLNNCYYIKCDIIIHSNFSSLEGQLMLDSSWYSEVKIKGFGKKMYFKKQYIIIFYYFYETHRDHEVMGYCYSKFLPLTTKNHWLIANMKFQN